MQAADVKRKTYRIDDDVAAEIVARAERGNTSENAIVNMLLRQAIEGQHETQGQRMAPSAAPSGAHADLLDALAEIENAARLAHLAAEAALQAIAYQRDHPNLGADEIVRHARRAAHHRLNPAGGPA